MRKPFLIGLFIGVFALLVLEETQFVRHWVMEQGFSNGWKSLLLLTNIGFVFTVSDWAGGKVADLI